MPRRFLSRALCALLLLATTGCCLHHFHCDGGHGRPPCHGRGR